MVNGSYNRSRKPREGQPRPAKRSLNDMIKYAQKVLDEKKKNLFSDFEAKKKARKQRRPSKNFVMRRRKKVREAYELGEMQGFDLDY